MGTIEQLLNSTAEGAVAFSLFAEGTVEEGASWAARLMVSLFPARLTVELEVANMTDEQVPGHTAPPQLQLGHCGIRGHCLTISREQLADGQMDESETPDKQKESADLLQSAGLKVMTTGFTSMALACLLRKLSMPLLQALKLLPPLPLFWGQVRLSQAAYPWRPFESPLGLYILVSLATSKWLLW